MPRTNKIDSREEPPAANEGALADRLLEMATLPPAAHVAVIGHRTLPFVLALMQRGCGCVRSLRPDVTAPDCEPTDLTWIVDVRDMREFDDALRAARRRAGTNARIIVEEAVRRTFSAKVNALAALRRHAAKAGLEILSNSPIEGCLVLAPRPRLSVAT
jgi:hypothetical protein